MALAFEHVFVVKAPPAKVWAYLTDPFRVAPALPGAQVTEKVDDATYKGTISVKVGPVTAKYRGTARFESMDEAARTVTVAGAAQDVSGRGGADMKMKSRLVEKANGETEVTVSTEVAITGVLAQFGRGMIQDVSNQMFERFTAAVKAELEKPEEPAAAPQHEAAHTPHRDAPPPAAPAPHGVSAPPASSPPIEVVSFGGQILARAAGRAARRPAFWIAVAAIAAIVYVVFFR